MRIHVAASAEAAALRAAEWLREEIGHASARSGKCRIALSGGRTPWRMLHDLRRLRVHWPSLEVYQVDERVVGMADERRNARQIADLLVADGALAPAQFHAMPVERADLAAAAAEYAALIHAPVAGVPAALDAVLLGLGSDGHTASLVPGDPLLEVRDRDVGVSGPYQGVRRMSLTFRALDAARHRVWLVTGADKAAPLARLWEGDASIPAGRVSRTASLVFADAAAAAALPAAIRAPH
jgi:6-phosphogluconolactonase